MRHASCVLFRQCTMAPSLVNDSKKHVGGELSTNTTDDKILLHAIHSPEAVTASELSREVQK
jgi:hypothetical protein